MSALSIGLAYGGATLLAMFSGMPIAFALGAVALVFMLFFMPGASLDTVTQNVFGNFFYIFRNHEGTVF